MKKPRCPICGGPALITPHLDEKYVVIGCGSGTGCVAHVELHDERRGPGLPEGSYLRRLTAWFFSLPDSTKRKWAIDGLPPPEVVME